MAKYPEWLPRANSRAEKLAQNYKKNLKSIAQGIAGYQNNEAVLEAHVDNAHTTLARSGLSLIPWYERPENRAVLAGIFVGGSFSANDAASLLFVEANQKGAGIAIFIFLLGAGIALYAYTFLCARLPRVVAEEVPSEQS